MASLLLLSANLRPYNRIRYLFFPLSLPYFICESVDFTLKCLELSEKSTNFAAEFSVYASLGRSHKDETTINIIITNKTKTLMKKFFTLISMALVAMSVNAQTAESWKASSLSFNADGVLQDMTSAANSTATLKKVDAVYNLPGGAQPDEATVKADATSTLTLTDYTFTGETTNIKLTAVSTPNSDTEKKDVWKWGVNETTTNVLLNQTNLGDECIVDFGAGRYLVAGTGNPGLEAYEYYFTDSDPKTVGPRYYETYWTPGCGSAPLKGCYYKFEAKKAGKLVIGFFLNKNLANNPLYIVDGSTNKLLAKDKISVVGFRQNCNFEKEQGGATKLATFELDDDYKVVVVNGGGTNRPLYGYITIDVAANGVYYMFSPKSQMGIFGFEFTVATGINNVKAAEADANAPIFNLAGQKADKSQKGILIQNGKKFVNK